MTLGLVILIAFLSILVSNLNVPNSDIIISIILILVAITIFNVYRLHQDYNKNEREAEERVKLLEKCREDIFKRLNGSNKILECYLNPVGKKGDKNK